MSKVISINFETSDDDLYKWIASHKNIDDLIKNIIRKEMNERNSLKNRVVGINGEMKRYRK